MSSLPKARRTPRTRGAPGRESLNQIRSRVFVTECFRQLEAHIARLDAKMNRQTRLLEAYLLSPGPGRPRHPMITRAANMHANGEPWKEIWLKCLPHPALYGSRQKYEDDKLRLRKAVKLRLRRADQWSPNLEEANPAPPAANSP